MQTENLFRWFLICVAVYLIAIYSLSFLGVDTDWAVIANSDELLIVLAISVVCCVAFPLDKVEVKQHIQSNKKEEVKKFSRNFKLDFAFISFLLIGELLLLQSPLFSSVWVIGCLFTIVGFFSVFMPTKYTL